MQIRKECNGIKNVIKVNNQKIMSLQMFLFYTLSIYNGEIKLKTNWTSLLHILNN